MPDRSPLPPGPPESPLRQLVRLVQEPYEFFEECTRTYGPIFTMRILGQAPWVMIGDPESVRTIFRASADELHGDADGIKYLVGPKTVLFLDGEAHRRERRVLNAPFKHERMARYAERMLASTNDTIDQLAPGQSIVFERLMQTITLRVINECIFGVTDPARRDRLAKLLSAHLADMQTGFMGGLSMGVGGARLGRLLRKGFALAKTPYRADDPPFSKNPVRRFFETRAEIDDILRTELARAKADGEERDDVLALLARAQYDDGVEMLDEARLDELFALLIGGHETTAISLSWAVWYLAQHPDVLGRARAEIASTFGEGPITAQGADRLRYLHAVIDETLRLRPVATSVPRKLVEAARLGGFDLPAGTRTFPAPAILHFREDLFPEPHVFRPERFLEGRPSPFHYLPFGGGSRACLGRPFAAVEMRLVLAEMIRRVDLRLADATTTRPVLKGMLTGPSDGVPVVIERVRPRASEARTASTRA